MKRAKQRQAETMLLSLSRVLVWFVTILLIAANSQGCKSSKRDEASSTKPAASSAQTTSSGTSTQPGPPANSTPPNEHFATTASGEIIAVSKELADTVAWQEDLLLRAAAANPLVGAVSMGTTVTTPGGLRAKVWIRPILHRMRATGRFFLGIEDGPGAPGGEVSSKGHAIAWVVVAEKELAETDLGKKLRWSEVSLPDIVQQKRSLNIPEESSVIRMIPGNDEARFEVQKSEFLKYLAGAERQ